MNRNELYEYLRADLYRYGGATASWYFLKALFPPLPAFRFIYFLRYASVYPKYSIRGLLARVALNHLGYKYGFQISPNTIIGKGLYIGHWGPVVINGQAEIGENCTLPNIVTVGQLNRGKRAGCPKIGNGVFIGTGAVLVGKITIGDNALIAPNAYVAVNVPENTMAVGNPARCFPVAGNETNPTESYVNFTS